MKIFVFEYISGGGMNDQVLPEGLIREGEMMLQALTEDLSTQFGVELYITRDYRLSEYFFSQFNNINVIQVAKDSDIESIYTDLCHQCDAVWPIAPESDGILTELCEIAAASNTLLLNTAAAAVEITGNKLTTFSYLSKKRIPVVLTKILSDYQWQAADTCVIKPIDGVGCENSFIVSNKAEYGRVTANIENTSDYIIQSYVKGLPISLSCLFKQGRAWLICCNEQLIDIDQQQFSLTGCIVNIGTEQRQVFNEIIGAIADALYGLWGYVGIDLIITSTGPIVLEINPRLTTSYVGIKAALGVNIAENVLQLIDGEPDIKLSKDLPITIHIK
jgi:predicted ATP-grasp superfamily ATP-dependent carboligase